MSPNNVITQRCLILETPLDPLMALRTFTERQNDAGAIVSFTGIVRGDDHVQTLTLSHYPGYTEQQIENLMALATERFDLLDALAIHRVGTLKPGEPIVLVATAAAHRRPAFEGADYLMDYLKSAAPFWKKEQRNDGSHWIEPTSRDIADRQRWESEP